MFPDLCVILPDLGQKIHYYTKFKLNPKFDAVDDPISLWFDAKEYLLEVTKYYMTQYLQMEEYNILVTDIGNNYNGLSSLYQQNNPIFEKGFVGMILASESGHAICQFDNIWLWMIE